MQKSSQLLSTSMLKEMLRDESLLLSSCFSHGKSLSELKGIIYTIQLLEHELRLQSDKPEHCFLLPY